MKYKKITALDLFSGCGGLTQGLKETGFNILAAVENDKKAVETYKANHPSTYVFEKNIIDITEKELLKKTNLKKGELDLLAGCPPCQGFSTLTTKTKKGISNDTRNDLIYEFLRFINILLPKTIMLENVPALIKNPRFSIFINQLTNILNYKISYEVVDAADYGVPQRRKRLILIASKIHQPSIAQKNISRITVKDSIGFLNSQDKIKDSLHSYKENRSQHIKDLISAIPKDGGSRKDLPERFHLECHKRTNGFHDVYGRMSWNNVAPTITSGCTSPSKGRFLHPEKNRAITLREASILQGFPKDYIFISNHGKTSISLMIGNAFPPPLIRAQAKLIKAALQNISYE